MRILIVEDEKRLASTLSDMLSEENYLVDLAYDGESGWIMPLAAFMTPLFWM